MRALTVMICACAIAILLTPAKADERSAAVDEIFRAWDRPASPGMTVAILKDGQPLYVRGYGMANIEFSVPNGPDMVYPLASNSKQFTAFAIHLLGQDGKLALTDDVRKYIPELHDFGTPITLDMLIHHTSGLREVVSLLDLAGHSPQDVPSRKLALDLLTRQRELNFTPGTRHIYCNSNYLLLGEVVERVSGMSLGEFWRQRIFVPLGMRHTSASDDPMPLTPGRASGYFREETGRVLPHNTPDTLMGPSGVNSTVGDLAKWLANFDDAKVGGRAVIDAMLAPGALSDGTAITYASGLHRERYRGLDFVEHSGHNWGYQTDILRFPAQHLAIIILANAEDSEPPQEAFQVADIYLKGEFPSPPPKPQAVAMPATLQSYLGTFEVAAGTTLRAPGRHYVFRLTDFVGVGAPLAASSDTDFFGKTDDFRVHFVPGPAGGASQRAIIDTPSGVFTARRVPDEAAAPLPADPATFASLTGDYWSEELGALYRVRLQDGKLRLRWPQGEAETLPLAHDTFRWEHLFTDEIAFTRDPQGNVTGFLLTEQNQRVRSLRFAKVRLQQQ